MIVYSSHGWLECNNKTGEVSRFVRSGCTEECTCKQDFSKVVKVDIQEWLNHYQENVMPDKVDILDIVLIFSDGGRSLPSEDFREMQK